MAAERREKKLKRNLEWKAESYRREARMKERENGVARAWGLEKFIMRAYMKARERHKA